MEIFTVKLKNKNPKGLPKSLVNLHQNDSEEEHPIKISSYKRKSLDKNETLNCMMQETVQLLRK